MTASDKVRSLSAKCVSVFASISQWWRRHRAGQKQITGFDTPLGGLSWGGTSELEMARSVTARIEDLRELIALCKEPVVPASIEGNAARRLVSEIEQFCNSLTESIGVANQGGMLRGVLCQLRAACQEFVRLSHSSTEKTGAVSVSAVDDLRRHFHNNVSYLSSELGIKLSDEIATMLGLEFRARHQLAENGLIERARNVDAARKLQAACQQLYNSEQGVSMARDAAQALFHDVASAVSDMARSASSLQLRAEHEGDACVVVARGGTINLHWQNRITNSLDEASIWMQVLDGMGMTLSQKRSHHWQPHPPREVFVEEFMPVVISPDQIRWRSDVQASREPLTSHELSEYALSKLLEQLNAESE